MTRFSKCAYKLFFHQPKNKDSYYKRIIVVEKAKLFFSVEPQEKKLRRQDFAALLAFPSTLNYLHTLLDFMENIDNFEARMERVNFCLFQSNSDFT